MADASFTSCGESSLQAAWSSAASAANAAIDHMRDWALGTNGKWVTMGVPSNGDYGIPKDVIFGGVGKTDEELRAALENKISLLNVE